MRKGKWEAQLEAFQLQLRHDWMGWYVCSDEEGEFEDEGNPSVGFDGRPHMVNSEDVARIAVLMEKGLVG